MIEKVKAYNPFNWEEVTIELDTESWEYKYMKKHEDYIETNFNLTHKGIGNSVHKMILDKYQNVIPTPMYSSYSKEIIIGFTENNEQYKITIQKIEKKDE